MKRIDNFHARMFSDQDGNKVFNRGTLRLMLDNELDIDVNRLFGLEFSSNTDINNVRITLLDKNLNSVTRYYVSPDVNNSNLLLFNKLGFNDIENLDCHSITEIRIDVYVENKKFEDNLNFEISNVLCFKNNFQLFSYFNSNEFLFPEYKVKGNIY